MTEIAPKVRLFVDAPLAAGIEVATNRDQANYLFNVMRLTPGDPVALFNGADGEWRAEVAQAGRRGGVLRCVARLRDQRDGPDLDLLFAPLRKARTDFVAEKATEMGVRRLRPVLTRHTNAERVNVERLRAHGIEAAEQCGILTVPEVMPPQTLAAALDDWDPRRRLMFCDETRDGPPAAQALAGAEPGRWGSLVGPEGGFSPDEVARLRNAPWAVPVALGPRILRADTAAVAALALWQATLGDWR
ncbi:MAG: 16S rRNA (uracil(1498)-N(3))-methyltransferase [Rubrimonas sp.]